MIPLRKTRLFFYSRFLRGAALCSRARPAGGVAFACLEVVRTLSQYRVMFILYLASSRADQSREWSWD